MVGHELTVEQVEMANLEPRHEPGEGHLGSVGRSAEHGLAEKGAAQFDAIQAPDQFRLSVATGVPAFDRVRMASRVEVAHGMLDRAIDPRLAAISTSEDHVIERGIVRDAEISRAQASAKRARAMETVERKDCPLARLDPEYVGGIPAVRHRKDSRSISLQQQMGVEQSGQCESSTLAGWVMKSSSRICFT